MSDYPEAVLVPRDESVSDLLAIYASGIITYDELGRLFRERGWSTLSLYEATRHIEPKKTIFNRE
jgi:hypothetical protein